MQYTSEDVSKLTSFTPMLNGVELHQPASKIFTNGVPKRGNITARVWIFSCLLILVSLSFLYGLCQKELVIAGISLLTLFGYLI